MMQDKCPVCGCVVNDFTIDCPSCKQPIHSEERVAKMRKIYADLLIDEATAELRAELEKWKDIADDYAERNTKLEVERTILRALLERVRICWLHGDLHNQQQLISDIRAALGKDGE